MALSTSLLFPKVTNLSSKEGSGWGSVLRSTKPLQFFPTLRPYQSRAAEEPFECVRGPSTPNFSRAVLARGASSAEVAIIVLLCPKVHFGATV